MRVRWVGYITLEPHGLQLYLITVNPCREWGLRNPWNPVTHPHGLQLYLITVNPCRGVRVRVTATHGHLCNSYRAQRPHDMGLGLQTRLAMDNWLIWEIWVKVYYLNRFYILDIGTPQREKNLPEKNRFILKSSEIIFWAPDLVKVQ